MLKIIAIAAVVLVVAIGLLIAYATTRPDTFSVRRTATIRAPADRIHPLINDLHQFNTWNPFEKKDPNIKGNYRGAASGPGAGYDFQGNKNVGKGSIEIVEAAAPTKVTMKLDMLAPIEGHNIVEFTLVPHGESTDVTWAMHGPSPLIGKVMGVIFNMDKMIGADFEAGLANLKAVAERS